MVQQSLAVLHRLTQRWRNWRRVKKGFGKAFLLGHGEPNFVVAGNRRIAALGENQISYLGFSYGTELGATYAEQYPDRVRAMVLDGAVDPTLDPLAHDRRDEDGERPDDDRERGAHLHQAAGERHPLG